MKIVLCVCVATGLATAPDLSGAVRAASALVPDTVVLMSYIVVGFKIVFSLDDDHYTFAGMPRT